MSYFSNDGLGSKLSPVCSFSCRGCSFICECGEVCALQQQKCIFPRSLLCCDMCTLAADTEMYSLLSEDRGCTVMYPFALLAFECVHSMIGTLDIHSVHRACLTLHEIWFLEKCNHGLEDCFLLSRSENDKLVLGGNVSDVSFIAGLFSTHAQFHCVRCLIEVLL